MEGGDKGDEDNKRVKTPKPSQDPSYHFVWEKYN